MAISKKSFVNLDLQGNSLVNPTIGLNSNMTKEGSFQYNAAEFRLEYFNGTLVEQVANLTDIAAVTGGLIFQGGYDPTTNTPDITVDNGTVFKGFFWVATVAGTFLGETVQVGDSIIAKQDNPGTTAANWLILQGNVVIATDTVDGIVRLATQTEVNDGTEGGAVVVTPATLQGKIDAQITPEINSKVSKSGDTMTQNLDMGGNNLVGANFVGANYLTTNTGSSIILDAPLDGNNATTIINLPSPTNGGDAANKTYVDDQASTAQANAEAYADSLAPNYDPAGAAATAESNANTYTDNAISFQSYRTELESGAWTLVGDVYEATVTHNITNTSYPVVTFTDAKEMTVELVYQAISGAAIKVYSNILPTFIGVSLSAAAFRA